MLRVAVSLPVCILLWSLCISLGSAHSELGPADWQDHCTGLHHGAHSSSLLQPCHNKAVGVRGEVTREKPSPHSWPPLQHSSWQVPKLPWGEGGSGQVLWWPQMLSRGQHFFWIFCMKPRNTSMVGNIMFSLIHIFPKNFLRYWKKAKNWNSCCYFLASEGSRSFKKKMLIKETTKAHQVLMPKEPGPGTRCSPQQDVMDGWRAGGHSCCDFLPKPQRGSRPSFFPWKCGEHSTTPEGQVMGIYF